MSRSIETLNCGVIEDFGFQFDPNVIRLGALPAISTEQFVKYSTETVLQILGSGIDEETRIHYISSIAFACGRVYQSVLDNSPFGVGGKQNISDETVDFVKTQAVEFGNEFGNNARNYQNNPFKVKDGKVVISNFYELTLDSFVYFSTDSWGGGFGGWNPKFINNFGELRTNILGILSKINPTSGRKNNT